MRIVFGVVFVLALVAIGLFGAESREVVVLHTTASDRTSQQTRLWVVDDADGAWLRAGHDASSWFQALSARPDVEVERGGETLAVRAVPSRDAADRARINALMATKYGWAESLHDWVIGMVGVRDDAIPIRLEPRP
jgi:hypothetical protein